ncbi:anti-sigma B factor antagonist [Caminicella sporogenes DSM 14501]|uniref:Anti-sigma factor antagonist n=1 Tax=Caminicella sporogenes DSM 14501 TaxID=1121266 RepID=A0A1M6NII9_9FIRM|nr:STAS domain-containing protein [Caminicella sporogenes]WIF95810.1 STAS domain-containing protein [Caminicella sporogenes]SHJ95483.1 anti-sigma B factor antagonist [Caminicella sporogenes DSM 14501]
MIETSIKEDIKIIKVFGEVNFENHIEFKEGLLRSIQGNENKIVLDMEKLAYLNSMGLSTIVKAYSELKKRKGELKLCSLQEHIKKLFAITKLDKIINIYENSEDALKAFQTLNIDRK